MCNAVDSVELVRQMAVIASRTNWVFSKMFCIKLKHTK